MASAFFKTSLLCSLIAVVTKVHGDEYCSNGLAEKQLQEWDKVYNHSKNATWSGCGSKEWLIRYYEISTNPVEIIFDIGCNKGYESALFMGLFKPDAGVTTTTLYDIHRTEGQGLEGSLCGACGNCNEKLIGKRAEAIEQEIHLFCFEPSLINFENLINARQHVADKLLAANFNWHLVNSAVGPKVSLVKFPRSCGTTLCQVQEEGKELQTMNGPAYEAIFMTSVDAYVEAEGLARIDVLKVDTEGHDPAVIFGSKGVLADNKVSLLYLEYNSGGLWKTVKLEEIITALDDMGYECYFEGTPTLTRLTGCWLPEYEFRKWANVVCAHNTHFMAAELEKLSWKAAGLLTNEDL